MKTVLVVEDNEVIREDVAEILSLANYNVISAVNGKEGIEKTYEHMPDLVISDIAMPIIDGLGMLHVLRKDPKTEDVPFIFLTSKSDRNDFRNAMDSGADDYITKPFNGDELLKAVENRFERLDSIKKKLSKDIKSLGSLLEENDTSFTQTLESLPSDHDTNIYQKKQVIYKDGATPRYLYYIQKGKVRTYKTHEDGKQLVMDLFNQGDFLGYVPLLEEASYKETAEAMEETELVMIPKKEFEDLVHKNPAVTQKLIKMLAKNITANEEHLLGIAYNTLRKKVAAALTSLQHKYQTNKNEPFVLDISRDELASVTGTAKESLIRTLTEFKNEHLIEIKKGNKIEVLNPKKLENLLR
jgi:CRP/FNR family transcriptional regulator, cyclic AMP receptor protein